MSDREDVNDREHMNDREEGRAGGLHDLEGLYAGREPPPELEARVVADFRSVMSGRLRHRTRSWTPWIRAAAAVAVFLAGWGTGTLTSRVRDPVPAGSPSHSTSYERPSYVMLLWEGESFEPGDDPAAVADAYAGWARSVTRAGIAVSGEELGSDRAIVGAEAGPPTGAGRIGGFFLLDATTMDEARRLAEGHPHVAAGGVIEIAPVIRR
jgi:hypothetical protein